MRISTDLGDWSTLPRRIRLAVTTLVGSVVIFGLAWGLTGGSLLLGGLIAANLAIPGQWIFTRRRPWWPEEPSWPVDIIDRSFGRRLASTLLVDAVVGIALAAGARPPI